MGMSSQVRGLLQMILRNAKKSARNFPALANDEHGVIEIRIAQFRERR